MSLLSDKYISCNNLWSCYFITSVNPSNKTYIGSTNSTVRRIRQHNREIVGGAKATATIYPCKMFCVISGFTDHIQVLRCEWMFKHPDNKRKRNPKYSGINGKIIGINDLLNRSDKWKSIVGSTNLTIHIDSQYVPLLETFSESITIINY